jgi:RNA polymerase sigma-70 factor (ECF subfamily)
MSTALAAASPACYTMWVAESQPEPTPADQAMERYAAGDDSAFAELYDCLAPRLYDFLVRQCRDRAHAEDLLQQTLLRMHRARGSFIPGASVLPWAFAIARRLFLDGVRAGRRETLTPDEELRETPAAAPAADAMYEADETARRLDGELKRLPESQRVAFVLVKQQGLSVAEAAEALGISVAAVKLRAHRAYQALRAVLKEGAPP